MNGRDTVAGYLEQGFRIVTWPMIGDEKGPHERGWPSRVYTLADYSDKHRVGIVTGTEVSPGKFIHDVDIDWAAGSLIAQAMLPPTGFVFGRTSKRVSHCFYLLSEALPSVRYEDVDQTCLIELRGTKVNGDIGLQTMVPPSVWSKKDRREALEFAKQDFPSQATGLKERVCLAAIGMILAKHLGKNGFGHEARLAWAGYLLRASIPIDDLVTMGEAMSDYTNNLEIQDVRRVVESTAARLSADTTHKIKGGPALAKLLGAKGKTIIARINEWLGRTETTDVVMRGGRLSEIVDRAETALVDSTQIYQRGGELTRAIRLDTPIGDDHDIRREAGSTMLVAVREAWLVEQMGRTLRWFKVSKNGETSPADPSPIYARTLLSRGEWRFPVLRGVVTAPTLARDGRIIETPGFDGDSGLLLDFEPDTFRPVPSTPTRADAQAALGRLAAPLRGFPFADDAARAVALSALMTALVRPSLRTSPLHAFDAPTAGTGKSLLAEATGLLATGFRPPALSQGKTAEEDEKRLATVLFAGDPVIHIDNCERAIAGDFLCSMLTQEIVQARILGLTERRVLPSTALVLASGNNVTLAGDASRRAVICRLDAKVERPDTRAFDFDCHAEILAARPELVVAGLTVLRAYHVAGRPEKLTPMGSFTDWEFIRGALVWLGCADPADTRASVLDSDPRKDELLDVMQLWAEVIGAESVEVAQIHKGTSGVPSALENKLIEIACRGGKWNGKSVGWWLRRNKDRVLGGWAFRCEPGDSGHRWRLAGAPAREPGIDEVPF
jgi:hypothetical protein